MARDVATGFSRTAIPARQGEAIIAHTEGIRSRRGSGLAHGSLGVAGTPKDAGKGANKR